MGNTRAPTYTPIKHYHDDIILHNMTLALTDFSLLPSRLIGLHFFRRHLPRDAIPATDGLASIFISPPISASRTRVDTFSAR